MCHATLRKLTSRVARAQKLLSSVRFLHGVAVDVWLAILGLETSVRVLYAWGQFLNIIMKASMAKVGAVELHTGATGASP